MRWCLGGGEAEAGQGCGARDGVGSLVEGRWSGPSSEQGPRSSSEPGADVCEPWTFTRRPPTGGDPWKFYLGSGRGESSRVVWGRSPNRSPRTCEGRREGRLGQRLACCHQRRSCGRGRGTAPRGPEGFGAFCPRRALPISEPSFPLYLDVLAPYVNRVNLIRAGVPTIVSRLHFAPPIRRLEAAWGSGVYQGLLTATKRGQRGCAHPAKPVTVSCVFPPEPR